MDTASAPAGSPARGRCDDAAPATIASIVSRPLPENWLRTDGVVAVVLAALGALMVWLGDVVGFDVFDAPLWRQLLGAVLLALPLALRRRSPIPTGIVVTAIYMLSAHWLGMDLYVSQVVLFLAFYSVGAWSARRGWALVVRIAISVVMAVWLVAAAFTSMSVAGVEAVTGSELMGILAINISLNAAFFAGAWVFGDRAWQGWLERRALEQAHEDIKALQDELVESAIETERLRIARELHDVVAHHVTAMSVQAAAARRLLRTSPERAEESLKSVEASGRSAVADLRTMVLTLRDTEETQSLPTLDDLEVLVRSSQHNGQQVTYERIGDVPELSPAVELTLYRVAQEGLTNAQKHAGPTAKVAVRLRGRPDGVEIEVSDDGLGDRSLVPGTGTGLQGMRERVTAVGGTLEAGPKPRGGFLVRAAIPTGADQ